MKLTFDQNLFTQTGLDSGALNMLGALTHSLSEPGDYRGSVHRGSENIAAFYIVADKNSPVAQANIDLSTLDPSVIKAPSHHLDDQGPRCCGDSHSGTTTQFTVNPKGFLVFHVSAGAGGYAVMVRKAAEDPNTTIFNSRELSEGDVFSASIIRPGTYSVENVLTNAKGQIIVAYPRRGETAYRPPGPIVFHCSANEIEPERADLQPGQGINFHFKVRSRIKIELLRADDGPGTPLGPTIRGWKKATLPRTNG
jgi:hypothetical protein